MSALDETPRIIAALQHIDSADREIWIRCGMAIRAEIGEAGFDVWDAWSRSAPNYVERDAHDVWRSFGDTGPVGLGSLFHLAQAAGWSDTAPRRELTPEEVEARRKSREEAEARDHAERQRVQAQAARWAAELLAGAPGADDHAYLDRKKLMPVPTLRAAHVDRVQKLTGWIPKGKAGELQGNLLAARCVRPGSGVAVTLELIDGQGRKAGLPGRGTRAGAFWPTSLPLPKPGEAPTILLGEGIATVLSATQTTGMFGAAALSSSNLVNVAQGLRAQYPAAKIIILADLDKATGKPDLHAIGAGREVGGFLAVPDFGPGRKPDQKDVNDLLVLRGPEAVKVCIERAAQIEQGQAEQQAQRFRLLGRAEIMEQPDQEWTIKPIFPSRGLVVIHGLSTVGKSFLAFDMGCHIAEGRKFFGHRVKQRPVVYVCLEGEAGFKRRGQAWEQYHGRMIPDQLYLVKGPFDIRLPQDIDALTAIIPAGAVVIIDTLNRCAPGAEENGAVDMGLIIAGAKEIERRTGGLVAFVAHPGKDESKGIRGHSSLFAALDGNIEVLAKADRFMWTARKVKDGPGGGESYFKREVVTLGEDDDGDPITSCVIVPDFAPSQKERRLSPGMRLGLETFMAALGDTEEGAGVHLEAWREHFYCASTADTSEAKKKAFLRARRDLVEAEILVVTNDFYALNPDHRDTGHCRDTTGTLSRQEGFLPGQTGHHPLGVCPVSRPHADPKRDIVEMTI